MLFPSVVEGRVPPALAWAINLLAVMSFTFASGAAAASATRGRNGASACLAMASLRLHVLAALSVPIFVAFVLLTVLPLGLGIGIWTVGKGSALYLALPLAGLAASAFLAARFSLAAPACVLEKAGPASGLARSSRLTKGARRAAFPLFFTLMATNAIVTYLAMGLRHTVARIALEAAILFAVNLMALAAVGALYRLRLEAFGGNTKDS
jgi:hypothetical protein